MRVLRRVVVVVIGLVLVLLLGIAVAGVVTARRSFPRVEGEMRLPGLDAPVDVYRDGLGIPHVYAETSHDLFFTQGFLHAQDRFWQMDFWRHIGSGQLSEMLGDSQVDNDRFLRTLGWARVAEEEWDRFDPEARAILEAYAAGVNAYLEGRAGSELSFEYAILRLLAPDYRPEPWTPIHTLTFAKLQAWNLGSSQLSGEIGRALLLGELSPEQLAELYPPYPEDHPVIVQNPHLPAEASASSLPGLPFRGALVAMGEELRGRVAAIDDLMGGGGESLGSNSWVIAGDRTESGLPLLANDPHLGAQMPSIWYQIGLHCTVVDENCPYNLSGFSFASAPGVIIGHNDRIAWGFTNLGPDVMDLYVERLNPENPDQYEVNGSWEDMQMVRETIRVAGGEPVELVVRYTRHGPIISDVYGPLEDFAAQAGIDLPADHALALRWTALQPNATLNAVMEINRAQDWAAFRQAARDFDAPSQNMVYTDVEGNIGYQAPGLIPERREGHDGTLPVPGWTDDYEWLGLLPFEALPYTINPPEGYIVAANNAVVGPEYPYTLTPFWDYGYRAERIVALIEDHAGPFDVAALQDMQIDDKDLNAEALVPVLLSIELGEARLERARDLLRGWDFQSGMESAPAALFQAFWRHLLAETFRDDLPESAWPGGNSRWIEVVGRLAGEPDSPWWDDASTEAREGRDEIFRRALAGAVDELESALGGEPADWTWGDLHTLTFANQSLGLSGVAPIEMLFNRGPFRTSGGSSIVDATGWDAREGYEVQSLPSLRMVVDLSDWENSWGVHPTGQSGHAFHPHYVDMADPWRLGEYFPLHWERATVEAAAENHLRLVP